MNFLLALTPILLILILMVGLRWSAAKAGAAGYLAALVIAVLFFGAGRDLLAYAHVKALLLTLDVLMIIWAAFLLYRVADEAGAIRTIGEALPFLTTDLGMQALIIGWVFASFLQGVGGFGVPVAVIAPLMISLGFEPLAAVVIPSIGHGWSVTFGSLGSSFQALMASTGLPGSAIAPAAGLFLGMAGLLGGWMVAHAVAGWPAVRRLFFPVLILGAGMGTVQFLVAVAGLWNIAAFAGSVAGLVIVFPLARRMRSQGQINHGAFDVRALLIALTGYALLVLIILAVQLIPAVEDFLGQVVLQLDFPELKTSLGFTTLAGSGRKIVLFRHTGILLLYASGLAYLIYRKVGLYAPGAIKRILDGTLRRVLSSSVSIASMVTMTVIMEHAGMTDTLARGLAGGAGALFPVMAPWLGGLGAFMTGSNTNSNVVFGALQLHTARFLGYSAAIILAAQTAGAALASVMAPTKVVVGASTAGLEGQEGEIVRRLSVYTVLLLLLTSLLTIGGVWLVGAKN